MKLGLITRRALVQMRPPQPALLFVCKGLLEQGKPFAFRFTTQWSGGLANTPA